MISLILIKRDLFICSALITKIKVDVNHYKNVKTHQINFVIFNGFICGGIFGELLMILRYHLAKKRWKNQQKSEKHHCLNMSVRIFQKLSNKI